MEYRHRTTSYDDDRPNPTLATDPDIPDWVSKLTPSELAAELERAKAQHRAGGGRQYRAADLREAVAHGLRAGFNLPVSNPHPLVADMRKPDGTIDLIAAAALAIEARTGQRPEIHGDGYNILAQGLSTGDFPDLLKEATRAFVRSRPSDALALLQAVTSDVRVPTYHPTVHVFASFKELPQPAEHTSRYFNLLKPVFSAESAQVFTSSDLLLLSRQAATDGEAFNTLEALASGYVSQALGTQVQMLADLVEGDRTLHDGDAWFADTVNSTTAALDATGLGAAAGMLRRQEREGGGALDARAATLLVPETHEFAALALMETLPSERRLGVVASARLSGDHWYLFADPNQHPAVARVLMQGAPSTGVSIGSLRSADVWDAAQQRDVSFPGFGLEVSHSVGFAPLSRTGLVRVAFPE